MDSNYVFLCGVMWCKFGQVDAAKELTRAADSSDANPKSTGLRDADERYASLEAVAGADALLPSLSAGMSVRATGRTVVSNALTLCDLEQSPISPKLLTSWSLRGLTCLVRTSH
jgi:hypothetical protein